MEITSLNDVGLKNKSNTQVLHTLLQTSHVIPNQLKWNIKNKIMFMLLTLFPKYIEQKYKKKTMLRLHVHGLLVLC